MKRIFIQSLTGIFCLSVIISCGKDVKAPESRPAFGKTSPASAPVTQTTGSDQNNHTCGSHSGSSGGGSSTANH